jgi:SAM-dependent methyltransferase
MPHARHSLATSNLRRPLADPLTLKAIEHLGAMMRETGFDSISAESFTESVFARFASGQPVDADFALEMLGGLDALRACLASGFVRADHEGNLRLAVSLLATANAVGVIPDSHAAGERVYVGPDTWILLEKAWRFGLGGRRAVELGTGSGVVATFLTSRYDHVVATDVTAISVAAASLARRLLDEPRRSRLSVLQADVGRGLRPQSFDFVIVNTPWIPTSVAAEQVFADGGPTGFELPLRFLTEGIDLLTEDGILVLLCADLRFADGRAPLADALRHIRTMGFSTEIEETPNTQDVSFSDQNKVTSLNGLNSGRHVSVIAYRKSAA